MISKNLRRIPKSAWCSNGPVAGFERNRWRKNRRIIALRYALLSFEQSEHQRVQMPRVLPAKQFRALLVSVKSSV